MSDDFIFWKATVALVLLYNLLRIWQRRRARKAADNDPWAGIEHR